MTLQSPTPAEASAIAVRLVDTPAGLDALALGRELRPVVLRTEQVHEGRNV